MKNSTVLHLQFLTYFNTYRPNYTSSAGCQDYQMYYLATKFALEPAGLQVISKISGDQPKLAAHHSLHLFIRMCKSFYFILFSHTFDTLPR